MGRLLALIAALLAGALLAWSQAHPPKARHADAAAEVFSAGRAMADVQVIGAAAHPVGSPQNAAVAAYLMRRLGELGLSPQLRPGVGLQTPRWDSSRLFGARVVNVVGVLPGRDRSLPALALVAHYDSVPASPGAADDAAGVAAILETVRAIKAKGAPARDVMVVLTDGEEAGLLGADAFFHRDPLAARVGFVVNLEARGSGGRVQMFQTGAQNGALIDLVRRTAVRPQATSLAGFIYDKMPNDTDFTVSRGVGLPGLNYAFIGRQFDYHSPTATPANLSVGTLQDMGDQVLASAGALAFAPALPPRAPDAVYSQLFGDVMLVYPPWAGWLILAGAAALIALGVWRARKADRFAWGEAAQGLGAALYAAVGSVSVLHLARQATGVAQGFVEQRALLAHAHRWELAVILIGLGFLLFAAAELARGRRTRAAIVPVLAAVASCALARAPDLVALASGAVALVLALVAYGRSAPRPAAWSGVLALGLLLGIVAQALAPLAAMTLALPLALAAIGAAATASGTQRSYPALGLLALLGAIGVGWIAGMAHLIFLGLDLPELLALPVLLAALLLWPLAQPTEGAPSSRALGPTLMIAGAVIVLVGRAETPWTARHPAASNVVYELDQDTGRAWLFDLAPEASPWSDAVLRSQGGRIGRQDAWAVGRDTRAAAARPLPLPGPEATLARQADGSLLLHLAAPEGARVVSIQLRPNAPVRLTALEGVPLDRPLKPGAWSRIRWEAAQGGVNLMLRPSSPGAVEVRLSALTESWPAGVAPLPPRPATVAPFSTSDSTLVARTVRLAW